MTLRTGTELITLSLLINKLTGVYGFLALFTGYHLSPLQLSMYIYSILALGLTAALSPHIRRQSPLQCLLLAWFYALDSLVNALYTVAFGVAWFLVLARHTAPFDADGSSPEKGPGGGMIDDTAGFTNPKYNVSRVDVVATPAPSASAGAQIGLVGHESEDAAAANAGGVLGNTILQSGSIASISVISALWAMRLYFVLILMAYARGVLRQSVVMGGMARTGAAPRSSEEQAMAGQSEDCSSSKPAQERVVGARDDPAYLENPFLEVEGWKGKLGRSLVRVPRSYWLGPELDEGNGDWMREVGGRFGRKKEGGEGKGLQERERRRRAGTGPPVLKPIELGKVRK